MANTESSFEQRELRISGRPVNNGKAFIERFIRLLIEYVASLNGPSELVVIDVSLRSFSRPWVVSRAGVASDSKLRLCNTSSRSPRSSRLTYHGEKEEITVATVDTIRSIGIRIRRFHCLSIRCPHLAGCK